MVSENRFQKSRESYSPAGKSGRYGDHGGSFGFQRGGNRGYGGQAGNPYNRGAYAAHQAYGYGNYYGGLFLLTLIFHRSKRN